jgi:hypothetical protein
VLRGHLPDDVLICESDGSDNCRSAHAAFADDARPHLPGRLNVVVPSPRDVSRSDGRKQQRIRRARDRLGRREQPSRRGCASSKVHAGAEWRPERDAVLCDCAALCSKRTKENDDDSRWMD